MKEARTGPPPNTIDKAVSPYKFVVPSQFQDLHFRFLKVRSHGKEALEAGWQKVKNYSWNDPDIINWIRTGGNYGITPPSGFACFVDADTSEIQKCLENKLPQTFRYSTGKPGHFQYVFFLEDAPIGCVSLEGGAYIKGKGGYALGPGSVHPNGVIYGAREIRNVPVAIVKKAELMDALYEFVTARETGLSTPKRPVTNGSGLILKVLETYGIDYSKYRRTGGWVRGPHPIHGSTTGINFAVNPTTDGWHCFRHGTGGGAVALIAVLEGIVACEEVNR